MEPAYGSTIQAANHFGIGPRAMRRWIAEWQAAGFLKPAPAGHFPRWRLSELDAAFDKAREEVVR